MEQVVDPRPYVEHVARGDAGRVQVGVECAGRRDANTLRAKIRAVARCDWHAQRGLHSAAKESDGMLLVRRQRQCRCQVRNMSRNLSAVIAPRERHPWSALLMLIADITGLLERLVMVDAEHAL